MEGGDRLKIISGWEARARALASFGARGLQGRWRWGGQSGIPPPLRGGVPVCVLRRHVCWASSPKPPRTRLRVPPFQDRAQPAAASACSLTQLEKKSAVIYYLQALIGLRHWGWGPRRRGDRGVRGQGREGGAAALAARGQPAPRTRIWGALSLGSTPPGDGVARTLGFASRLLPSASSPFPGSEEEAKGCTPSPVRPSRPPPRPRYSPGLIYHHLWSSGVCKEQLLHSAGFRGRLQRESGR